VQVRRAWRLVFDRTGPDRAGLTPEGTARSGSVAHRDLSPGGLPDRGIL